MTPRRYEMKQRASVRERTRKRIVEAAAKLHSERGIFGTSWQDIAAAADVSVATVYNHFPSLDELVPACGDLLVERLQPPTPESAPHVIGSARGYRGRLERAASELFGFYERAGALMEADFRERELPSVREWEAYQLETVAAFVREALAEDRSDAQTIRLVSALLDYPTFKAFRARGIGVASAATTAAELATFVLERKRRKAHRQRRS